MIETSLQDLFEAIASTPSSEILEVLIKDQMRLYFQALRGGIFLFEKPERVKGKLNAFYEMATSPDYNPMLRYLVNRNAPVHEEVILPPGVWSTICPFPDHAHVMAGPILCSGRLVGAIGFTRDSTLTAFNQQNLADLSALCLHVSSWIMTQRTQLAQPIAGLTPREQQIAHLVAQGLTNAEIGAKLWITENSVKQALKRMFRKLKISSRIELVTALQPMNSLN